MGRTVICIAILVAVMILGELLGGTRNSKGAGLFVLFLFWPLLLAVFVFIFGRGFRRRISSGLTIICSIILLLYIHKLDSQTSGFAIGGYILFYPFICAGLFAVLFAVEWFTRFFKDRGFRGWWGVPFAFFVLLLVCVCYPVVVRYTLIFLSRDAKVGITFHVVDSEGRDVPHASVRATFHTDVFLGISDVTEKAGETSVGGIFFAKQKTHQVSYSVEKDGYYMTQAVLRAKRARRHNAAFVELKSGSQTLKVVLKEKRDPAALYVKHLEIHFPQKGVPYGFDCVIGDLVEPDGKGKTADLIFTHTGERRTGDDFNYELRIETVNDGGFLRGALIPWSEMKSPYTAPESGYDSQMLLWARSIPSVISEDSYLKLNEYLVFETYSRGEQPCVGKIYGELFMNNSHKYPEGGSTSYFLYFFNPVPGDRRIESDPDRNLFGKPTKYIELQP